MSRVSLLDPFLMFFVLAAFGALLLDRDQARRRLAERTARRLDAGERPAATGHGSACAGGGSRPRCCSGLALGTKWSAHVLPRGVRAAQRGVGHHRAAERRGAALVAGGDRQGRRRRRDLDGRHRARRLRRLVVVLVHAPRSPTGGSGRSRTPDQGVQWLPPALRSFWKYHQDMWAFHNGLETPHSYAAHPLGWIVQWRPTSFFYPTEVSGPDRSGGPGRVRRAQLLAGHRRARQPGPVVVRGGGDHRRGRLAVPVPRLARGRGAVRHRRRLAAVVRLRAPHDLHVLLDRVHALGRAHAGLRASAWWSDRRTWTRASRRWAIIGCGVLVALIVVVSAFFYPIWSAWVVPYDFWHSHMWLQTWV